MDHQAQDHNYNEDKKFDEKPRQGNSIPNK